MINQLGRFTSAFLILNAAVLANAAVPIITYQPRAQTVILQQPAAFGVVAQGKPPLRYQWLKNGAPISGATADEFVIPHAQFSDAGAYSVVVSRHGHRIS